jgi:hypothetical protein
MLDPDDFYLTTEATIVCLKSEQAEVTRHIELAPEKIVGSCAQGWVVES